MKISKVTKIALEVTQLIRSHLEWINSSQTRAFSISCCAVQVCGAPITCWRYLRVHQCYLCLDVPWMFGGLCAPGNYATQWSLLENYKIFFLTMRERDRSTALILNYFDFRPGELLTWENVKQSVIWTYKGIKKLKRRRPLKSSEVCVRWIAVLLRSVPW